MGCPIDLDDFGTGHASIASIRRFAINRIKIDRSYVTQVDTDPSQQRMVAAVLSMADRLGLQTLAEGVETIGEHAMLSQLGCSHVQGFVIARPMPIQATGDWICKHRSKLRDTPHVGRQAG
jgi:EAL domain-containing protein (putative c-di-GMP-specific phosphodiesterase class I)